MGYELGEKRNMDMNKKWEDHANFLGQMAGHVAWLMRAESAERVDAIEDYTRWLSEQCFKHAAKHCREDDKKAPPVDEQPKTYTSRVPGEGWNPAQEDISDLWNENERKFCEAGP